MIYPKEVFKRLWDLDDEGGGITFDDVADCAKAWGLYSTPKIYSLGKVRDAVLKAAHCET